MIKYILTFVLLILSATSIAAENPLKVAGDTKQPIQIDADALEVFQEEQKAIFSGNVIAKQGEMTVKASKMTIFYDADKNKAKNKDMNNSIRRIDLDGNVVLTSPGQSAKSSKGFYDTQKNQVSLSGDVTLTKDGNILKGNKLDYFIDTGYSKIYSEASKTGSTNGRVRGLFVPSQETKK